MTTNTSAPVDVLAVMDREIDRAGRDTYSAGRELIAARAAVAEMVEALRQSDEWVRAAKAQGCNLPCENTLANNRAALAKFGGA